MRAQAAENDVEHPDKREHRAKEVAKGFFWQTPGAILPYVVALILLLLFGDEHSGGVGRAHIGRTYLQYMLLVGVGAIPSIIVLILSGKQLVACSTTTTQHESAPGGTIHTRKRCSPCFNATTSARREEGYSRLTNNNSTSMVAVALPNKHYWNKLIGTGVSWALYDFVYYGTAFNQPEILSTVLGDSDGLIGVSWRDALVAMMG